MFKEFIGFLNKYGVIALAIAVIIGGKLNEFVTSLVNDIMMPIVFQPALQAAGVSDIRLLNYNGILYGKFIGATLDFIIVAFVVFLMAKHLFKDEKLIKS